MPSQDTTFFFGVGKMGKLELHALCASARKLGDAVIVIDPKEEARSAAAEILSTYGLPLENRIFADPMEAFRRYQPTKAVMACGDADHKPMLDLLQQQAPGLRALYSEKPLTKTIEEAREVASWLEGRELVTENTVINFSSVFPAFEKLHQTGGPLSGAKLIGAEGAWLGGYHSYHRALPIGVAGDMLHPMAVITQMLGAGPVRMVSGKGAHGYLNGPSPYIIHDVSNSHWRGTQRDIDVRLRSCYSGDADANGNCLRERRVIGYFRQDTQLLAVEFNFDRLDAGYEKTDTMDLYRIGSRGKARLLPQFSLVGGDADIDLGYAAGAPQGKAQAFIGQSERALKEPRYRQDRSLTTLAHAIEIQEAMAAVTFENPALVLQNRSGYQTSVELANARASGRIEQALTFGSSLGTASATNIEERLNWFGKQGIANLSSTLKSGRNDRGPAIEL